MRNICLCITVSAAVAALASCSSTETEAPPAQVRFVLSAPLCSSSIPVSFYIDGAVVGSDTFRVNFPPNHVESKTFSVKAGNHSLGARTISSPSYVWRDTVVNANTVAVAFDTLSFYCS